MVKVFRVSERENLDLHLLTSQFLAPLEKELQTDKAQDREEVS